MRCSPLLVVLILISPLATVRAEEPTAEDVAPGHSYHGETFDEGPRQRAYLMGNTGNVHFPVTTDSAEVQRFIDQGVGQLHGFWYFEAERSFRQAAALDPDCAMAYWGMSLANINNAKRGPGFIAEAVKRKDNASPRERLYIDALDAYWKADSKKKKERGQAYIKALQNILYQYPDDIEAKAFLALQLWQNRSDIPIASHLAVEALLDQVLAVNPMHPCHHYVIHLWDDERPERALASAARCGQSAPAIAHMWHMPGHTYSKLKRYHDAVWQQEASARVDHAHMMRDRILPDQIHNFAHNNEWLIRNLNFIGRVHDAVDLAKNMIELPRHPKYNTLDKRGSAHFGRLRLFETCSNYELWDELIALCHSQYLAPTDKESEQIKRQRFLGRAYFSRGDIARGQAELEQLEIRLREQKSARDAAVSKAEAEARDEGKDEKQMEKARNDARKSFAETIRLLERAIEELNGHRLLAEGQAAEGLDLLKKSGLDEFHLARLQLAAGQLEEAEKTVRSQLKSHRQEVRPLAILVEVLWAAGRRDEAKQTFAELRDLSSGIDLDVPVFTRLAPIARELGYGEDWRVPRTPAEDVGERPTLESLGPFRWEPPQAPEWTLADAEDRKYSLAQFHGQPVVMIFYLGHGCLHCVEQLQTFAPKVPEFTASGIGLIAVSTDGPEDLRKSVESYQDGAFPIPLVSDADLNVFKAYRAYDDFEQQPLHATVLIDGDGRVRWQDISHEPFQDPDFLLKEARRLLFPDQPEQDLGHSSALR